MTGMMDGEERARESHRRLGDVLYRRGWLTDEGHANFADWLTEFQRKTGLLIMEAKRAPKDDWKIIARRIWGAGGSWRG